MKNVSILFLGLALAACPAHIQGSESRVSAQTKSSVLKPVQSRSVQVFGAYPLTVLTVCAAIISMAAAANSENPS